MFTITFTKDQAEQFIKESLHKNFINVPEFIVRISDEEGDMEIKDYMKAISSGSALKVETATEQLNPWLVPDENGWFTHNPGWVLEEPPSYINPDRLIHIEFRDHDGEKNIFASGWVWKHMDCHYDIIKWKYA